METGSSSVNGPGDMQQQLAALEAQRAALEQRHKELAEAQQREEARRQELEAARAAGDQASDAQKLLLLQEQVRMLESRVGSVGSGLDHLAGQQHSMFEATRLAPLEVWRPLPAYTPQEGSAGDEARLILEQCRVDAAPRKEDYDKLRATCPPCPELEAVVSLQGVARDSSVFFRLEKKMYDVTVALAQYAEYSVASERDHRCALDRLCSLVGDVRRDLRDTRLSKVNRALTQVQDPKTAQLERADLKRLELQSKLSSALRGGSGGSRGGGRGGNRGGRDRFRGHKSSSRSTHSRSSQSHSQRSHSSNSHSSSSSQRSFSRSRGSGSRGRGGRGGRGGK